MTMMFCNLSALLGMTVLSLSLVHALPIWHDFNPRGSIVSFVTGFSFLLAGGVKSGVPYYLTTPSPTGSAGDLTVSFLSNEKEAPLFLVRNGRLLHHTNESHILHVNVLSATRDLDEPLLFRLTLADQRDGLLDAMWRWSGAFLHLDYDQKSNHDLYFMCLTIDGRERVYTSLDL
ncbi:hypothetical protein BC827DRAFT_1264951 [Russula dissimulans]|nr:hypothetical protein BC827DRAFT_1264951 [Russula dissimulans]